LVHTRKFALDLFLCSKTAAPTAAERGVINMSAPNLSVTIEPFVGDSVCYAPLAPRTSEDNPTGQLSLVLTIISKETAPVHVNTVTISFTQPPKVDTSSIPVDKLIEPATPTKLYFQAAYNIILPIPAPDGLTIGLVCDNFGAPAIVTSPLAPYRGNGIGYFYPAKLNELRQGEFWLGRSGVHEPAGGGVQAFAYDLEVQAFDGTQWIVLVPGGSWNNNEDYRIWGKSVVAIADGTVQSWANDWPTNPNPPKSLSPPNPVEGNHFYIQHGTDLVLYAHMQPHSLNPNLMIRNAPVKAGDFLGLAGNSGHSSGPHLHVHAIQGMIPWEGPPRPILFRDINVIDRSVLHLPDPSGPWASVNNQGLPSVEAAIWPSPLAPVGIALRPSPHYLAIDPLALLLGPTSDTYIRLTLPDPPPIDVWTRQLRDIVSAMTPQQRRVALRRVSTLDGHLKVLKQELEQ
jgi:hypothetical protein